MSGFSTEINSDQITFPLDCSFSLNSFSVFDCNFDQVFAVAMGEQISVCNTTFDIGVLGSLGKVGLLFFG